MIKKFIYIALIVVIYQIAAIVLLYNSNFLNLVSYYVHPPYKGMVEIERLPMLFGDSISYSLISTRKNDINDMIKKNKVGIAALLSSYQHEDYTDIEDVRKKSFDIAKIFISNGYDLSRCEYGNKSVATLLKEYGALDNKTHKFLLTYLPETGLFTCTE